MFESVIKPKKPKGTGWIEISVPDAVLSLGYPAQAWQHDSGLSVISAVDAALDSDNAKEREPHYHISISKYPQRCDSKEAKWVLRQFDLEGAEEDNHVPHGIVRNFFRPVADNLVGMECPCKKDEPAIKESKGDYIWRPAE